MHGNKLQHTQRYEKSDRDRASAAKVIKMSRDAAYRALMSQKDSANILISRTDTHDRDMHLSDHTDTKEAIGNN